MDPQQLELRIAQLVEQRMPQAQAAMASALAAVQQQQQQSLGTAGAGGIRKGKLHDNARYGGAGALDAWLASMRQYADFYGIVDDTQRVAYAASHFKDVALQWWQALSPASRPATWDALVQQLRTRFQPVTSAELARERLFSISQGKSSVQAYTATFQSLLTHVPTMGMDDRVFVYVRGLNERTHAHVNEIAHTTLESAIERAMRFGSRLHPSNPSSAAAPAAAPMDLDALGLGICWEDSHDEHDSTDGRVTISKSELLELHAFRAAAASSAFPRTDNNKKGNQRNGQARSRAPPVIPHMAPHEGKAYMDAGRSFGGGSGD